MTAPAPRPVVHLLVGLTRGGAERLLVDVLPATRRHGVEPSVLALKGWGPVGDELQSVGIPVTALGGRGKGDPRPVLRLLGELRRRRPSLLHAHLFRATVAGDWACRWAGVPLAVHYHSLAGDRPLWHDRLEGAASRRARARIAVSAAVAADRAARLGLAPDAIGVVANGIETGRLDGMPPPPAGRPLVAGFLGRLLVEEKGLDVLLEALARPGTEGVRLEIAGGPAEVAQALEARARSLGLGNRIRFLGEVPSAAGVLAGWDLLVLPSRQEGFGLALLEAMAAGRPVVATRAGGIPEVVEEGVTGILVPPGEVAPLAAGLAALAADTDRLARLGRAARERVEARFTAARTAAGWSALAAPAQTAGRGT